MSAIGGSGCERTIAEVDTSASNNLLSPPAPQTIFFRLTPYILPSTEDGDISPVDESLLITTPSPPVYSQDYHRCMQRLGDLHGFITPEMQASLKSLLQVLQRHMAPSPDSLHPLIMQVASTDTSDQDVRDMAHTVTAGLRAFAGRPGREKIPIDGSDPTTTASSKSKQTPTSRSGKVRQACILRDNNTCVFSNKHSGDVAHIIAFSVKDAKAVNFWKLVSMFHGEAATQALKMAALSPKPENADNLKNVLFMAKEVHDYFDRGMLALVPQLLPEHFPYNPWAVTEYKATVEFPHGDQDVAVAVWKYPSRGRAKLDRELSPGDTVTLRTADPKELPLPHPLLLQLHAILSRVLVTKAATGFPTEITYDDGYTEGSCVDLESCSLNFEAGSRDGQDSHSAKQAFPSPSPPPLVSSSGDTSIDSHCWKKRPFEGERLDYYMEQPRKVSVVLGEYEERMQEREQLARKVMVRGHGSWD